MAKKRKLDPTQRASDENPLPRKHNGDGYTVTSETLAGRLGWTRQQAYDLVIDSGVPRRPWYGDQLDIKPADADRLVEQHGPQRKTA